MKIVVTLLFILSIYSNAVLLICNKLVREKYVECTYTTSPRTKDYIAKFVWINPSNKTDRVSSVKLKKGITKIYDTYSIENMENGRWIVKIIINNTNMETANFNIAIQ